MTAPIVTHAPGARIPMREGDPGLTRGNDGDVVAWLRNRNSTWPNPAGQLWERLATIGAESDSERSVVALPLYSHRIARAYYMVSTSSRFIPSASRAVQIRRGIIVAPNRDRVDS